MPSTGTTYSWVAQVERVALSATGTMFVSQPDIPVPLAVDFPFPAWATRPSEKGVWAGVDDGPDRPVGPVRHHPRRARRPAAVLRTRSMQLVRDEVAAARGA
jgi:hypothetical protein